MTNFPHDKHLRQTREEYEQERIDHWNNSSGLISAALEQAPNIGENENSLLILRNVWIKENDRGDTTTAKFFLNHLAQVLMNITDDYVARQVKDDLNQWDRDNEWSESENN